MIVGAMLNCSGDKISPAIWDMTMAGTSLSAAAQAKINLTLDVIGRRADGYHDLESLVISVGLSDRISCALADKSGIEVRCADPALCGRDNLVYQAAARLARRVGATPGLRVDLEKHIPVGGGMGGGSSDAAAMLHLCNELWRAGLGRGELAEMGAELGSDVPLFFALPAAIIRGRGEKVEAVSMRWSGWALLAFVGMKVSTRDVYDSWRADDAEGLARGTVGRVLKAGRAEEILPLLSNHLQPAVFRVSPAVRSAHEKLEEAGLGPMRVSGAGATFYRLFDEKEDACRAARKIEDMQMGLRTSVVSAPAGPGFTVKKEH